MADADIMTLPEYAKGLDKDSVDRPLVELFAASADFYQLLQFAGLTGPTYEYYRQAGMPESLAFRAINEPATAGRGRLDPFQEASYVLDHDLDVDRAIVDRYGPTRRAREETLAMAAAGRLWARTFLSGDNTTNPREFNGIKKRCSLHAADRVIHNSAASGGAALSLANLDTLLNMVSGANAILAPRLMRPLWTAAARNTTLTGFVIQNWDAIGQPKPSYAGVPIYYGYEREIEGDLMQFNEVASGGGSAVTCSIYAIKFGDNGLKGLQIKPMEFNDYGLLQDGITYRTHLTWDTGLVDEHPYCIARLDSITNAAIVA